MAEVGELALRRDEEALARRMAEVINVVSTRRAEPLGVGTDGTA
jgi:hypothetical protein